MKLIGLNAQLCLEDILNGLIAVEDVIAVKTSAPHSFDTAGYDMNKFEELVSALGDKLTYKDFDLPPGTILNPTSHWITEDCYNIMWYEWEADRAWVTAGMPVMIPVEVSNGTDTKIITIPFETQKVGDKVTIINDEGSSLWTIVKL